MMSRLRIEHRTVYRYRQPVSFGPHRLVLRPREGHDLQVESMQLKITPPHRLVWARDIYSNSVAMVDFLERAEQLEISSTVIVSRSAPLAATGPVPVEQIALPVDYDVLEAPVVAAYRSNSYPDDATEISLWLRQFEDLCTGETRLMALCSAIFRQIKYQRRTVKGVQTPAETIKLGSGSCRDMATLMMDAARVLGLAARFVSGYLDCPASQAGYASMHAWAEIYLPILGWRGFDPTLGQPTSLKHIAVGVSQHPRGVMPISGVFTGAASDYIDLTIQVKIGEAEPHTGTQGASWMRPSIVPADQ